MAARPPGRWGQQPPGLVLEEQAVEDAFDDLDYMHARFYSPVTARFLSADPVLAGFNSPGEPQTWNGYSYARGNPIRRLDPDGLADIEFDLLRRSETDRSTIGSIRIFGTELGGVTLELPGRGNRPNISRIPAGRYPAAVYNSPGLRRPVLLLAGTKPRTYTELHPGTRPSHTKGCILVAGCVAGVDRLAADRGETLDGFLAFIASVQASDRLAGERTQIFVNIVDTVQEITAPRVFFDLLVGLRFSFLDAFLSGWISIEGVQIGP